MIQVATSPCALVGLPGDLIPLEGETVALYLPTLADLFRLDPRIERMISAQSDFGCWLWQGATVFAGNGRVPYGRICRGNVRLLAHRWVYTVMVGPIDPGHELHHECCTPLCVNPRHLEALHPDDHDWLHREASTYTDHDARSDRIRAMAELTRTQRIR